MKMDRTSWIGIFICVGLMVLAFTVFAPDPPAPRPETEPELTESASQPEASSPEATGADKVKPEADPTEPEQLISLKSDKADFVLSTHGGGIARAVMTDHYITLDDKRRANGEEVEIEGDTPEEKLEPRKIALNQQPGEETRFSIGALGTRKGEFEKQPYTIKSQSDSEVVLETTLPEGLKVQKSYHINHDEYHQDGHSIVMELELTNEGTIPIQLDNYALYGGSATPFNPKRGMFSGFYWQNEGKSSFHPTTWFNAFLIFKDEKEEEEWDTEELGWAGVSTQFFATIVRPVEPQDSEFWAGRYETAAIHDPKEESKNLFGVECSLRLPDTQLNPGEEPIKLIYEIYMGPKEWERVKTLPADQGSIMAYNKIPIMGFFFGWIIKPCAEWLVYILVALHGMVGNYGWGIILLTILLRILMWPLHSKAHMTSKRMAALTPKLNDLKEKLKDDPQKMQQEQMKLWRDYGVNPMGGCLPALVQIPIFLGYFRMLQSSAEIRHEPFVLWIQDLSMPDTVGYLPDFLGGYPINILPFLMTITSYFQFAMMPKTGDATQRMLFKLFPLMFFFILYNFPSGLALYWTFQNLISVLQTWYLNQRPLPKLVKKKRSNKKGFLERMQEQADAAQKAQAAKKRGESPQAAQSGGGSTNFGEKGPRKQKAKQKSRGGNRNRKRKRK